ncbi:MAG: multicopper oxidase domain-containing protein [Proteobacteria bacterium]|nr:multicopper oxidase domain-containing protein [Pseudomonadota bacterium]
MAKKAGKEGRSFCCAAFLSAALGLFGTISPVFADTVSYKIDIEERAVNFTGKNVKAYTFNGSVPGPVIEATEGDLLKLTFCNRLNVDTSVHKHGILLPNKYDGVPYLNAPPVAPDECRTDEIQLQQHGTYWYHAHDIDMKEQTGMSGPIVIHPKNRAKDAADHDAVVFLSDWMDERPMEAFRRLRATDGDFYARKKNSVQSWNRIIAAGAPALEARFKSVWNGMGPMDVSDIGYDAFLANGRRSITIPQPAHGEKARLRVINGATSTFFNTQFACGPMTIVANDGVDVRPVTTNRILIGTGETYDVIVSMPHSGKACEFRATAQDGTGYASAILGAGKEVVRAPDIPRPNLLVQEHARHSGGSSHDAAARSRPADAGHGSHHETSAGAATDILHGYDGVCPVEDTSLDGNGRKWKTIDLTLTGRMNGYVWSFNDRTLSESDLIKITKGQNVRVNIRNDSMMAHTYHMHGDFFRVVNKKNPSCSPLKHTLLINPGESYQTEFPADRDGDWIAHCHIAYHMAAGMARILSYEGTPENREIKKLFHDSQWLGFGDLSIHSHLATGSYVFGNADQRLIVEFDAAYNGRYDLDPSYEFNIRSPLAGSFPALQNLRLFAGADVMNTPRDSHNFAVAGVRFSLFTIDTELRVAHTGEFRVQFGNEHDLTNNLSFRWQVDTSGRHMEQLKYYPMKDGNLYISLYHDSAFRDPGDRGSPYSSVGAGLGFTF